MSQYKVGTATVNKGSAIVTGSGTSWLTNVNPGDGFTIAGTGVPYAVGDVDSDTQITLSEAYAGSDQAGVAYAIWRDFTASHGIPELSQGDIETATIFTRAMRLIDGAMLKVGNLSLQGTVGVYGSVSAGETATVSGEYFFVELGGNELKLYRNDSGSGTLVGTYPLLEDIQAEFDAKVAELQSQQDAFQADHVRLSRSLSKTPDLGDTLRLDFATNGYGVGSDLSGMDQAVSLLELVTFTRAGPGTYYDAAGVLQTAAIDEPRLTYDPDTLEPLGLLIEEARTNLLLWSEAFDNSAWAAFDTTIQPSGELSPLEGGTVYKVVSDAVSSAHFFNQDRSINASTKVVFYFIVKAAEYPYFQIAPSTGLLSSYVNFDLSAGVVGGSNVESQGYSPFMGSLGGGWHLCGLKATTEGAASSIRVLGSFRPNDSGRLVSYTGDGTSGGFVAAAQLEVGAFPTSYIKTEGSQVTRAADNARVLDLGSWANVKEGTLVVEAEFLGAGNAGGVYGFTNGSSSNRIVLYMDPSGSSGGSSDLISAYVGTDRAQSTVSSNGTGRHKMAVSFDQNTISISVDGSPAVVSNHNGLPTVDRLDGQGGSLGAGGTVTKFIKFIPRALTAAELEELTAL